MSTQGVELTGWVYMQDGDWNCWYRFFKNNFNLPKHPDLLEGLNMAACLYEQEEDSVVCAYRTDECDEYNNYDKIEVMSCNVEVAKLKIDLRLHALGYVIRVGEHFLQNK